MQIPVFGFVAIGRPATEGMIDFTVGTSDETILGCTDDSALQWPTEVGGGYAKCPSHVPTVLCSAVEQHIGEFLIIGMRFPCGPIIISHDERVNFQ